MKYLRFLNTGALVVIAFTLIYWLGRYEIWPRYYMSIHNLEYRKLVKECDLAMVSHANVAKTVKNKDDENAKRMLQAAQVELTICHIYDKLRKKLLLNGINEEELNLIGLEVLESRGVSLKRFIEPHVMK